ncbi:MAG: hypothetical protein Q8908_16585, partial [Bacteroidota bacterium]|nr:hypothetical protein [Bacteroidota bacterium]
MKSIKDFSLVTLGFICLFISVYRLNNVNRKEISWDVLGYYLYLPSTFIYHQPLLRDIGWLEKINKEKDLAGTLYMVSSNDKGEPIYFFLMGMALFFLPFFFLGHILALLSGFPADGFSPPYQYAMVIGGIFYTIIGLIFLRKILKHFFSEGITSLVLLIVVFGTNYIHHFTLKDLETGPVLFMLVSILLWHTIQWHQEPKRRYLIIIGSSLVLVGLVKPSELCVILLPLLWNVYSWSTLKEKFRLFYLNRKDLLITALICLCIAIPQMAYWLIRTGHLFYDSYKNPGVGLDFLSPHIIDVLFSYRKGWLVYTPVMIFALAGFYFLYKENRKLFPALIAYFLVSFYLIASWTEWWYGSAFSNRPLITVYPVLSICLGYCLLGLQKKGTTIKAIAGAVIVMLVMLNQFQWWQLKHYILDPYRTTKAYYWATFLKTSVQDSDKELLLVNRSFTGNNLFDHREQYVQTVLKVQDWKNIKNDNVSPKNDSNYFYRLSFGEEYFPFFEMP